MYGIQKKSVYSTLQKQVEPDSTVANLEDVHSSRWMGKARAFALGLYGNKGRQCNTVDDLCHIFATTTDKPAAYLPPPRKPSINMH